MVAKYYTTTTPPLGGEIKRRIADFKVREITPDKNICAIKVFTDKEKLTIEKNWPSQEEIEKNKGKNAIFEMEKYNVDLNEAIRKLSRALHFSKKRFGYAGLKDRRAITCQRVSIWQPDFEKLKNFNSRYVDVRFVGFGNRIEIGDLWGNEFEITIRNIKKSKEETEEIIKNCFLQMQNGIANYFGEQRFGGARNISHLVGKEFVKGNFENAVMLYLTSTFPAEEEEIKQARIELAKTKDFSAAIKNFPPKFRYERAILHHLCKYNSDYINAFRKLPKSLIYLFTHAYQSYLFNKYIDKRFETGIGLNAVDGDVIKNGIPQGPLFGYEFEFAKGLPGEIEREILEEEGLTLANFKIKSFPELSSKGTRRSIILKPENPKLICSNNDELNENCVKVIISFALSKGNYATTVLREIIKKDELESW